MIRLRFRPGLLVAAVTAAFLVSTSAFAQLGQMISPGPLAKAHARLEGASNCVKCHEQGRRVSAARCLDCHKDVAARIAQKRGVHRNVKDDCVACHVDHAGRDAELRPFDTKKFDHRAETGFPLDGRHALDCARCHRQRSYLGLEPRCISCHRDPHKPSLGTECATCHTTAAPFKESGQRFDHSHAFPLEGAHARLACTKCHAGGRFKGLPHQACTDCHRNPHKPAMGSDCRSCHGVAGWRVAEFDHGRTGTPLRGRHQSVPCVKCHTRPATQAALKMQPCAVCHKDPHAGQFRKDCAACHDERGFRGAAFDHVTTRFPLTGKHAAAACDKCHRKKGDFRGLRGECASCHADPHRAELGASCETCHTTATFKVRSFQHPRFPEFFGGQHAAVACEKCHKAEAGKAARSFRNVSTECGSCHRDVHAGQMPDCRRCHTVDAPKFAAALFRHDAAAFRLTGKHATVPCASCHKQQSGAFPAGTASAVRYRPLSAECRTCHRDVHLAQLGTDCGSCHSAETFRVTSYTHRRAGAFLTGRHAVAKCDGCHKRVESEFPGGQGTAIRFTGIETECAECHRDPHAGALGTACSSCHGVGTSWANASRAFHKRGLFPLEGRHLDVPCAECHRSGVIRGTPTRCYDCHWIRRQDDRFHTALGNECEDCHRPIAWSAAVWDHAGQAGFPLGAAHQSLACDGCHRDQTFAAMQSECGSCHLSDYGAAREPNHQALGFPLVCQLCHRPADAGWDQARFDHSGFALAGRHGSAPCASCHGDGVYRGTTRDCATCHRADFQSAADPNHAAAGFTGPCETCHRFTDPAWADAVYAHTAWPFADSHHAARCADCHASNVYAGRSHDCVSCHRADYDGSKNPAHAAAGFPVTCEICHRGTDATWDQGTFDHSTFALAGAHTGAVCSDCHRNGVYDGTPRDCYGCHRADFESAADPGHVAAGFQTTCESCHRVTDSSWDLGTFDHSALALAGAHVTAACTSCHVNGVYAGTTRLCSGCHTDDFTAAQDPNHVAAGFPNTCDTCHKFADASWDQGVFAHTTFPLAGQHLTQLCLACHTNNVYAGTTRLCSGCHTDDFTAAQDPNHVAAGFPNTCDTCHKFADASWDQGVFAHTTFPLAGQHLTQVCLACHTNNVYAGTTRLCSGCHTDDFTAAQEPNHVAAGFPNTCDTCHKFADASWDQGVFAHTTFQLAGQHLTQVCLACHANNVYAGTPRICSGCHRDDYDATTDPMHSAAGFPTTCDSCHKFADSSWTQGVFDHSAFRLRGVHATEPCSSCHGGGVYAGTPRICSGCHLDDYDATTDPKHSAAGFPTTCDSCHRFSDTSWSQGVFDHDFPIDSGAHAGEPCSSCHTNSSNYSVFTCTVCHTRGETDPDHDEVSGYVWSSAACYSCHPNGKAD